MKKETYILLGFLALVAIAIYWVVGRIKETQETIDATK